MNTDIKIGIVEDELIIAEKIKLMLEAIGYAVCEPVNRYDEAVIMLQQEQPDLVLLDVMLAGNKDGIHIAEKINELYKIPFIFLTANSDALTVTRAKQVKPYAYIVKPFTKDELYTSIEIAFNNFSNIQAAMQVSQPAAASRNFIFIKDDRHFLKLFYTDIVYIESRENYIVLFTADGASHMIRFTLASFLQQLPHAMFIRVHRSYVVNVLLVNKIIPQQVLVANFTVPLGNAYRDGLFAAMGIS